MSPILTTGIGSDRGPIARCSRRLVVSVWQNLPILTMSKFSARLQDRKTTRVWFQSPVFKLWHLADQFGEGFHFQLIRHWSPIFFPISIVCHHENSNKLMMVNMGSNSLTQWSVRALISGPHRAISITSGKWLMLRLPI